MGEEDVKSSRRLLGLKPAAMAADFVSVLGPAAPAAFEGATDFSRMNAGRHQAAKANTFATPPSLVKPFTPAAAAQRKAAQGPTRELLEVFEMGVSRNMVNLRNELREELAVATDALRQDVMSAIADMRGLNLLMTIDKKVDVIKEGPVTVDMQQVLDEIRLTHTSIRDALQNSTHAIVRQVGQQTMKLGEDLRSITTEQNATSKARHEQATEEAERHFEELRTKLDTDLSLHRAGNEASERGRQEVRQMHWDNKAFQERAGAAAEAAQARDEALAAKVAKANADLDKMTELQSAILESQQTFGTLVRDFQKESTQHQRKLLPWLQQEFETVFEQHQVQVDFAPVLQQIRLFQHLWGMQFPKMMGEIGKIQQAVNVDFVQEGDYVIDFSAFESQMLSMVPVASHHGAFPSGASVGCGNTPQLSRQGSKMLEGDGTVAGTPEPGQHLALPGTPMDMRRSSSKRGMSMRGKRMRHYWCQTDAHETLDSSCQTDGEMAVLEMSPRDRRGSGGGHHRRRQDKAKNHMPNVNKQQMRRRSQQMLKPVFADSESMKQRARKALIRPQYRVTDMYHETGYAQMIAKSAIFEYVTLGVIFLNAIWIAVDADLNKSAMLYEAHPVFQIAENMFCVYFVFELLTRFLAFKRKRSCLKDRWFVFDGCLVFLMVLETWVITLIFFIIGRGSSSNLSNFSLLRIIRMIKLLRISRMARLMRGLPELFILLKGLRAASRSVALFWVLWWIIIYVFALVFRLTTEGESDYFSTVPDAMNSLLLEGILPNHASYVRSVAKEHWVYWPIMLSFIAVAYVLLMNMLVGVLVEVVQAIAVTEKEGITVVSLAGDLRTVLTLHAVPFDRGLSKESVERVLSEPDFAVVLETAGADVMTLADMLHAIFEDQGDEDGLVSFEDFVEAILNLRGMNPAKVKDVKGQLRAFKVAMKEMEAAFRSALFDEISELRQMLSMHLAEEGVSRTGTLTSGMDWDAISIGTSAQLGD